MLSLLFFPLFLLNFAGIVGGIWLVFLGEWKIVVAYTIGSLLAIFFLGFFLLPSAWLSAGAAWLFQRGWRLLGWIVASANILWCVFIVTSWCFGMFSEIASLHETGPLLPYLLFAYGVTLGPWTYLASQDTEGSMLIVFFALLGLVAMMIVQEFALPVSLLLAFGVPMIGGALLQILLGLFVLRAISAERK